MRQASPGQWGEWQMSCPLWPWALALANVKLIYFKVFKISLSFFFSKAEWSFFFFFSRFFMLCWVYVDVRGCKGVIARWLCNGEKQGGGAALQSRRGLFCMRFCCVASWYGNAKSKCWCVEETSDYVASAYSALSSFHIYVSCLIWLFYRPQEVWTWLLSCKKGPKISFLLF